MNLDRTTILISIRPVYARRILAGTKTVEFRRQSLPDQVTTALIWETQGAGIVGRFDISEQIVTSACSWSGDAQIGIDLPHLYTYAGGKYSELAGIYIRDLAVFPQPVDPTSLHPTLTRPPQSWRYAPEGWQQIIHQEFGPAAAAQREGAAG